jgi:hypothetical protein
MKTVMKQILCCGVHKIVQIEFADNKMQDSMTHRLEKAELQALSVSVLTT